MPNNQGSKFDQYEELYVEERVPLKVIAEEYGLSYLSLMQHSKRKKWRDKQNKYYENVTQEQEKLVQIRSYRQAKKLEMRTLERSKNWEYLGKEVLKMFEKRKDKLTSRDMELLIKTYRTCCMAQRLEDSQPTVVQIVRREEYDQGRNPIFESVLESEDALVDKEFEVEELKKELNKYKSSRKPSLANKQ